MGGKVSKANRAINPTTADKLEMAKKATKNHIMYISDTTHNMGPVFLILLLLIIYLCCTKNTRF